MKWWGWGIVVVFCSSLCCYSGSLAVAKEGQDVRKYQVRVDEGYETV
jgi:hypothetical protein